MNKVCRLPRAVAPLLALAAVSLAGATPSVSVVASFRISDTRTSALATNATGQVAGFHTYTAASTGGKGRAEGSIAFVSDANGASPAEVDPLTGTGAITSGACRGMLLSDAFLGINAGGAAVGTSAVSVTSGTKTGYATHAALYSGGVLTDLGTLGGTNSAAKAINASGLIVGGADLGKGKSHAFSSDGTTMTDLGTLGGDLSVALGVNDTGTIVGASSVGKGVVHPFSYAGGTMTDLGLPTGFAGATATAIASDGTIVGFGDVAATSTGKGKKAPPTVSSFVYASAAYTVIPSLYADKKGNARPMRAAGVNASGIVVGSTSDASGKPTAFVYSAGAATDLTTLLPSAYAGYTVVDATAISDAGFVSATALDASGKAYAMLLKVTP